MRRFDSVPARRSRATLGHSLAVLHRRWGVSSGPPPRPTVQFGFATLFGSCKVRVPKGTKVDLGGFVLMGGNSSKVQPGDGEANNSISIRFYALAGGVSVESD